jgi:hypothetical protein
MWDIDSLEVQAHETVKAKNQEEALEIFVKKNLHLDLEGTNFFSEKKEGDIIFCGKTRVHAIFFCKANLAKIQRIKESITKQKKTSESKMTRPESYPTTGDLITDDLLMEKAKEWWSPKIIKIIEKQKQLLLFEFPKDEKEKKDDGK